MILTSPGTPSQRTFGASPESTMRVSLTDSPTPKESVRAVDLEVVDRWLAAGEQEVRTEMLKGGSMQRIALLTGSKKILENLKHDIRGPRFAAAPAGSPREVAAAPTLNFMKALDGEKLTEYLARVKEEAAQRSLPDVVGFVQAIEFRLRQGEFDGVPVVKKIKKYAVPNRDGNVKLDEALNLIASPKAADKYRAVVEALAEGPATDDELRSRLIENSHGMVPGTVTAYRGDLARAGWVRYTGQHRKGDSGSSMKVWELAP